MTRKNGASRESDPPIPMRISYVPSVEISDRIREASVRANVSLSAVIEWCVERGIDAFERAHPSPIRALRPGPKPRIKR